MMEYALLQVVDRGEREKGGEGGEGKGEWREAAEQNNTCMPRTCWSHCILTIPFVRLGLTRLTPGFLQGIPICLIGL